jgi:hypothetical protein
MRGGRRAREQIYNLGEHVLVPSSHTPPLSSQALWEFFATHKLIPYPVHRLALTP